MARQLSEQLEREVSAEEFLQTQSKPNPRHDPARRGTHPVGGVTEHAGR